MDLKAPGNYSDQFRSNNFSSIFVRDQNPHLHDFGIFGRVQTDTRTPQKIKKNLWNFMNNIICCEYGNQHFHFLKVSVSFLLLLFCFCEILSTSVFIEIREDKDREMRKIGQMKSPTSWI